MAINQIATIAVMVADENKAKEWYKKKLNFEVISNEPHWIVGSERFFDWNSSLS